MALIKCSECGKDISDKAEACPHCGCPVALMAESKADSYVSKDKTIMVNKKTKKKKARLFSAVIVVAIVIAISVIIFFPSRYSWNDVLLRNCYTRADIQVGKFIY